MDNKIKCVSLFVFIIFISAIAAAQTSTAKKPASQTHKPKTTVKKAKPVPVKDITVTLDNKCERTLAVFAGPRAELKTKKVMTIGGLSKNTLHLKTTNIVCVMTADGKKEAACVVLKPGMSVVEIGSSATTITGK